MTPLPQIAILDFGSQYTHLIARRIRQLGVLAMIYPPTVALGELKNVKGIVLSGGPQSVHDNTAIRYNKKILDLPVPILGLCYGHQLLVDHYGGAVLPGKVKEYGIAKLQLGRSALFNGLKKSEQVWMSHGDSAKRLPVGFYAIGKTSDCPIAAMANDKTGRYGLQFHPEVAHTVNGLTIIRNFVFEICQCRPNWTMKQYWQALRQKIKTQVGKRKVFLLVSGGVDSSVAFAILEKILGKRRVFGVHIDNGFMRLDESRQVKTDLAKAGFTNLKLVDASDTFVNAVTGVVEPEEKRAIIGRTFLTVKDRVMKQYKLNQRDWLLGQGTIYPDTIETGGTKHADTIKTHHNRVKEVVDLLAAGLVVEPLVELYKDEVRELGQTIGLPKRLINRQPFPGPGLAIRVLCSDGKVDGESLTKVNRQLNRQVRGEYRAQALPVKSVGVQGDNRTYRHPALLQGPLQWNSIAKHSVALTNAISGINRVVYLLAPKTISEAKIILQPTTITKARLDLLRRADDAAMRFIKANKLENEIWQFPVVLAPLSVVGGETIILRPIQSREAMTVNFYQMPPTLLRQLANKILALPGVDAVLYDVTNKPPGTIEWE